MAASIGQATRDAINADMPLGAWAAAAEASSKAPTLGEIRKGSFAENGWADSPRQQAKRASDLKLDRKNPVRRNTSLITPDEMREHEVIASGNSNLTGTSSTRDSETQKLYLVEDIHYQTDVGKLSTGTYDGTQTPMVAQYAMPTTSAYSPPPKIPWMKSTIIGLRAFWKWFLTPSGFLVTIYALNVVAWGGMLFLLLCNAAPAMCWVLDSQAVWIRDCDHQYSARRIWMEIDSQILNALFCVTGLGLIPWRFRDLYYLLRWRLLSEKRYGRHQKMYGLRTLGGIYNGWVRLPGSDTLDEFSLSEYDAIVCPSGSPPLTKYETNLPSVIAGAFDPRLPWKLYKTTPPPPTGVRATSTTLWKIDLFVWCNVWNTFFQGCLCGFMWGMNRFDRPSWSTGLFIALACIVSGVGGIMSFNEGKKIKRVEGVHPNATAEEETRKVRSGETFELHFTDTARRD